MSNLSPAMLDLLSSLKSQKTAAETQIAEYGEDNFFGGYSAWDVIGGSGCHRSTCEALLRRGLATEGVVASTVRTIAINDAGLNVLKTA